MVTVNIHEAKTHFSKLVAKVEAGEEVVIARDGVPVARLTAIRPHAFKRTAGRDKGLFTVAADFDAPVPESLLDEFESGSSCWIPTFGFGGIPNRSGFRLQPAGRSATAAI